MSKPSDKSRPKKGGAPSSESAAPDNGALAAPAKTDSGYFVLARKYRPKSFEDLIGQDVMVRTLRNAFAMDRIAQAYMLTGVRGVGKTTTARILARALNYQTEGGPGTPSLDMPEMGIHCAAIMESRHVDVLEMDAASNTGIDDIREIIEAVRYRPASARYRVFIIDEVHMLSKSAFNGLLKTLEEPPPHVKFIFATTEIRKVPVTILSRCQRFDLRRVEQDKLADHFEKIVGLEGQNADRDALLLIARAAEGSVRDGLSLLDQALALGGGKVTSALVLEMLGIAGRGTLFRLVERIFEGDAAGALSLIGSLHDSGGDPLMMLTDLADAVHTLTRLKAVPGAYPADLAADDKAMADRLAANLTMPRLTLAWQMLLKGHDEVARAARPFAALEMLLIRMCYAGGLPSPADLIDELRGRAGMSSPSKAAAPAAAPPAEPVMTQAASPAEGALAFRSFEEIADHAGKLRDIMLKVALEEQVELVQFGANFLELHLLETAPRNLAQELSRKLQAWTGERWVISLSEKRGEPPLGERKREAEARTLEEVRRHPTVKRVLHHFPGAEVKTVRKTDK